MTTPQDSPRRRKQKARRTKQLLEWRIKQASKPEGAVAAPKKTATGAAAKKTAARKSAAAAAS